MNGDKTHPSDRIFAWCRSVVTAFADYLPTPRLCLLLSGMWMVVIYFSGAFLLPTSVYIAVIAYHMGRSSYKRYMAETRSILLWRPPATLLPKIKLPPEAENDLTAFLFERPMEKAGKRKQRQFNAWRRARWTWMFAVWCCAVALFFTILCIPLCIILPAP